MRPVWPPSTPSFWDQNGCLSARVHFVEGDAADYAADLAAQMRSLSAALPRGTTPRRLVHRAFDSYAALAGRRAGAHALELRRRFRRHPRRPPLGRRARSAAPSNACQGRMVVVRPVEDVMKCPPSAPAARGQPAIHERGCSTRSVLEPFAEAVGARGVTALRSLGRAAFPQLAYSWDGLLPLDVGHLRPAGYFTTIEFDDLEAELAETAARWEL